jgi:hypothetical protein
MQRWPLPASVVLLAIALALVLLGPPLSSAHAWERVPLEPVRGRPHPSWCIRFFGCIDGRVNSPFGDESGKRVHLSEVEYLTSYAVPVPPVDARTGEPAAIWWRPDGDAVVFAWTSAIHLRITQTSSPLGRYVQAWRQDERLCRGHAFIREVRGAPALVHGIGSGGECTSDLATVVFVENGLEHQLASPLHDVDTLVAIAEDIAPSRET